MNDLAPMAHAAPLEPAGLEPRISGAAALGISTRVVVGCLLVALSFALWAPLPVVPFLPLAAAGKTALAGSLFVGTEVSFWGGILLAGPQLVRRLRRPWRAIRTGRTQPLV